MNDSKNVITVKNDCGIESVHSNSHSTIHLQDNGNGNFAWTLYKGATVNYYVIYRDSLGTGNFTPLSATIPGTNTTFTDITASSIYLREHTKSFNTKSNENLVKFIFEPELPKILHFFDTQVISLLIEQAFLESELSRTASRFISMDQAESEADRFINTQRKLKAVALRSLGNINILENYASLQATRKELFLK